MGSLLCLELSFKLVVFELKDMWTHNCKQTIPSEKKLCLGKNMAAIARF